MIFPVALLIGGHLIDEKRREENLCIKSAMKEQAKAPKKYPEINFGVFHLD